MRVATRPIHAAVAGLLLTAACASSPDPRCSDANCEILHACGQRLVGEPAAPEICLADFTPDASVDYCVKACQANSSGTTLDCIASNFATSCPDSDGGRPTGHAIQVACGGAGTCGPNCQACQDKCSSSLTACNSVCPDAGVCLDCEYACSQTSQGCFAACPTN